MAAVAASAVAAASALDPAHAMNITVYHVNPHRFGAIPLNMDVGNAPGDLFFDLFEVMMAPLSCKHHSRFGHMCANPEATGHDLVVNKLTLEVALANLNTCSILQWFCQ